MLSLQSFLREGRIVGPCWEKLNPKGPLPAIRKDAGLYCGSRLQSGEVFAYVGLSQNLKDLKDHWRAKRDPKAQMLSLQSFLREGRVVGPCWQKFKPKGPKGPGCKMQPVNLCQNILKGCRNGSGRDLTSLRPRREIVNQAKIALSKAPENSLMHCVRPV